MRSTHAAAGPPGRVAVFAYGSLVSRASCERTLGSPVEGIWAAELRGWRRGFTLARANRTCEKTFSRADTGEIPEWVLALNVESSSPAGWVNGALIELSTDARARLDARELRYARRDVSAAVHAGPAAPSFAAVYTYVARSEHHAPTPPEGAVILRSYAEAVESAFADLGRDEVERFRASTAVPAVELIDGILVRDSIPPGNPRDW